jgi:hypothetical protein
MHHGGPGTGDHLVWPERRIGLQQFDERHCGVGGMGGVGDRAVADELGGLGGSRRDLEWDDQSERADVLPGARVFALWADGDDDGGDLGDE